MKWRTILGIYTAFILLVILGAYLRLIPTEIKAVPFYDSLGHFILYGTWGYLFGRVLTKTVSIGFFKIPIGIVVVGSIAVVEECLQSLSTVRTFSLFDLGWGILGICFAAFLIQNYSIAEPGNDILSS